MATAHLKYGTIGVVSGELGRYSRFPRHLVRIDRPEGTALDWAESIDIAAARNAIVRNFLKTDGQWLWFIDDDMVFGQDVLTKLLATPTDVVQPLTLMRIPPHPPTMYEGPHSITGLYKPRVLNKDMNWLVPVDACGTGGMLIQRRVLKKLGDPWFEVGQIRTDSLGEDLHFCEKVKEAGFTIHVATDIRVGHITPIELWPIQHEGQWATEVRFSQVQSLVIDAATQEQVNQ